MWTEMASYVFLSSLITLYARSPPPPPKSRVNYSGTPDECVYTLIAHSWHSSRPSSPPPLYSARYFHTPLHLRSFLPPNPVVLILAISARTARTYTYIYISFCLPLSSPFLHITPFSSSVVSHRAPPHTAATAIDCRKTTPLTRIQTAFPPIAVATADSTVICPHKSEPRAPLSVERTLKTTGRFDDEKCRRRYYRKIKIDRIYYTLQISSRPRLLHFIRPTRQCYHDNRFIEIIGHLGNNNNNKNQVRHFEKQVVLCYGRL